MAKHYKMIYKYDNPQEKALEILNKMLNDGLKKGIDEKTLRVAINLYHQTGIFEVAFHQMLERLEITESEALETYLEPEEQTINDNER